MPSQVGRTKDTAETGKDMPTIDENVTSERGEVNSPQLAYEENARFHRHFLDWRHRILVQHFAVQAMCGAVAVWCRGSSDGAAALPVWVAVVPLGFAFLSALAFLLLDVRNKALLDDCCSNGQALEGIMRLPHGFYSSRICGTRPRFVSYTVVLRTMLVATMVFDFGAGYVLLVHP